MLKKELIGNFYRAGKLYTQGVIRVNDHDFPSQAEGKSRRMDYMTSSKT